MNLELLSGLDVTGNMCVSMLTQSFLQPTRMMTLLNVASTLCTEEIRSMNKHDS